jgi:hypothetical protein
VSGSMKTRPGVLGGGVAQGHDRVHASPYKGLPSPLIASVWGTELDHADDPDLERFVGAYRQGPQTPEPGADRTGGVGESA